MTVILIIIGVFLYGLWYVDNNWQKKQRKRLEEEITSLTRRNQSLRETIKAMQQEYDKDL
ncbi:MAG TPA: hypothetical protein DCY35_03755 [Prolixibacteraceae bacterium]|nr:hypothetical protein [Prolixibacteraceae bacterium]